jgi:hypothetical protein
MDSSFSLDGPINVQMCGLVPEAGAEEEMNR